MRNAIAKILRGFEPRHSTFQIENFIIGKSGSPWSQYRQIQREVHDRYHTLIDQRDALELFDLDKRIRWPFGKRARIQFGMRKRIRVSMVRDLAETERELRKFIEIGQDLQKRFGDLDRAECEVLEADSWRQKALKMAGIDLLVNGRIGQSTMELILALPEKDRSGVLAILSPQAKPDPMKLMGI